MKKNLVLYHAHCTDGFGSAFAAWLALGDENTEYLPANYGQINTFSDLCNLPKTAIENETTVYILDFSLPRDVMDQLFEMASRVVWLDHHKTAFEMYDLPATHHFDGKSGRHHIELDNSRSGALLSWNYFFPDTDTPMFIRHIDDRDRWQFKINDSKEFHCAIASMKPWSFKQWADFFTNSSGYEKNKVYHDMYVSGRAILRAHDQNVKSAVAAGKRAIEVPYFSEEQVSLGKAEFVPAEGGGYRPKFATGLAANCPPHLSSDAGHVMANESGTFGLCWYPGRNGKAKVSLRSNGNYDVSAIAKSFGGGGHKNAAGFEIELNTLIGWMK